MKIAYIIPLCVAVYCLSVQAVRLKQEVIELETAVQQSIRDSMVIERNFASNGEMLKFIDTAGTKFIEFYVCPTPVTGQTHVDLFMERIEFSIDDATSRSINFNVDGIFLGTVSTPAGSHSGDGWNIIRSEGITPSVSLTSGSHTVQLNVTTGDNGIYLDKIIFWAEKQEPSKSFLCGPNLYD